MKKEFMETVEWFSGEAVKYGVILAVVVCLYMSAKRVWVWIVMPILLLISIRQVGVIADWQWVTKLGIFPMIAGWVFLLSTLSCLFEKK